MDDSQLNYDISNHSKKIELDDFTYQEEKINFSQDTLELAFQLIADASVGRITHFERTGYCLKLYRFYLSGIFRFIRMLFHLTLVALLFYDSSNRDSQSRTAKVCISIEFVCLAFYAFQLILIYKFSIKDKFVRDKKHYVTAISIIISITDIILYSNRVYQFRINPALRVLLFINSPEQSQIRRHLRTLKMTMYNVLIILPFILTFYIMMVIFIYRYFKMNKTESLFYYNGKPYMRNLLDIIWDTLVYITSANSPDVMLPAFSSSSVMGILFLVFYALIFFLLIFIYGLIMCNFRDHAKKETFDLITGKMGLVYDSFLLLSEKLNNNVDQVTKENHSNMKDVIKKEKFDLLIQHFKKYKNCKLASDLMYSFLSRHEKTYLTKNEYMELTDLISIPLNMVSNKLHYFEKYLWFGFSNKLADLVENKYFNYAVGIVIVINTFCITFTSEMFSELFFTCIFILEISTRIYTKGAKRFFRSIWNTFDFFVIMLAFVFWFMEFYKLNVQTTTFTLLILRNLRLLKLLRGVPAYNKLLHILGMLIPTIISLIIIVFCFTILYISIGIWSYQGLFYLNHLESDYMFNSNNCNNSALDNSDFGRLHYCILSFNSFISGFQTLCSVSIGNNWHTITEGYELASGEVILTRLYFSIFKGVITYLLLLIMAFVLDVFLLAYNNKSTLKIEDKVNDKIKELNINFISYKNVRDSRKLKPNYNFDSNSNVNFQYLKHVEYQENIQIWFRLKAKGARSVEYVSQTMFQNEIEIEMKNDNKYKHFYD